MKRGLLVIGLFLFLIMVSLNFVISENYESVAIEKASDKLNIGEKITKVFTGTVDDEDFDDSPNCLSDRRIDLGYNSQTGQHNIYDYEQKISLGGLELQIFRDADYEEMAGLTEKTNVTGFRILPNTYILNYTIDFITDIPYEDLLNQEILFLCKTYNVIYSDGNSNRITLNDSEGNIIEINNGIDVKINGKWIDGLRGFLYKGSNNNWDKIVIEWRTDDESFITEEASLSLPPFGTLRFRFTGMQDYYGEQIGKLYLDAFYEEEPTSTTTLVCTDYDDGLDYDEDSYAEVTKEGTVSKVNFEDRCLNDFSEAEKDIHVALGTISESDKDNDNILLEAECLGISEADLSVDSVNDFSITKLVTKYECEDGCNDGECIGESDDLEDDNDDNEEDDNSTISDDEDNEDDNNEDESTQNQERERIKSYIQNKEVKIERNQEGKNIITVDGEDVGISLEVIEEDGKVYVLISGENKEVRILANEAIEKAKKVGVVKRIEIKEEKEKAVYSVKGTKKAWFFFVIPLNADVEQNIDVEDGSIVSTKRPWWHIFAIGI